MAQIYQIPYSTSATISFVLYDTTGQAIITSASFQTGDVLISMDNQPVVSATNLLTSNGNSFSLVLTQSETTCRSAVVTIIDTSPTKTWLDTSFVFETYGTSASYHPDIGNINSDVNGVDINELFTDLVTSIYGEINRAGDVWTFRDPEGSVRYILSAGQSGRTRLQ